MKQINILMIGGRRCGKTTVLSSMYREIGTALAGTGMSLQVTPETAALLNKATDAIKEKMNDFSRPLTRVEVDDNPTSAMKTYRFNLQMDTRKSYPFQIHDIPGEWLTGTEKVQNQVRSLISECQVIIIAIDTPYLFAKMTDKGYGIYHEEYNKPNEITNFFKNSLSTDLIANRMILFVPIKCERYYHLTKCRELNIYGRNYMQEIVDAVDKGYGDLIHYLRSTPALANNTTIAITPILSAGGIDFVRFRNDTDKASGISRVVSLYQEPEFLAVKGYSPKFCEQPMIYALLYILNQELNQESGFMNKNKILRDVKRDQLAEAIDTLRKKLKRNTGILAEDGFYFIQNPNEL